MIDEGLALVRVSDANPILCCDANGTVNGRMAVIVTESCHGRNSGVRARNVT